jgi:hypothetical protein
MNSVMRGMKKPAGRRSLLKRGVAAGAATLDGGLFGNRLSAAWANHNQDDNDGAEITRGDILAAEILDGEISHESCLNAYVASKGARQVNFDGLRPLPTGTATGARQIGRLTNPMELSVDTSWWSRYRSAKNPDFGATLPEAIQSLSIGKHPAIPRNTGEHGDSGNISAHLQAFANAAGWHFAFTEQGQQALRNHGSQVIKSLIVRTNGLMFSRFLSGQGGQSGKFLCLALGAWRCSRKRVDFARSARG